MSVTEELFAKIYSLQAQVAAKDAALMFYAKGDHMTIEMMRDWESASGEPTNWLCAPSDDPYMVEDGSVARTALGLASFNETVVED